MRGGYDYKKCMKILRRNGWKDDSHNNGGHKKFVKDGKHISLTWGRDINIMLFNRICKENGICK